MFRRKYHPPPSPGLQCFCPPFGFFFTKSCFKSGFFLLNNTFARRSPLDVLFRAPCPCHTAWVFPTLSLLLSLLRVGFTGASQPPPLQKASFSRKVQTFPFFSTTSGSSVKQPTAIWTFPTPPSHIPPFFTPEKRFFQPLPFKTPHLRTFLRKFFHPGRTAGFVLTWSLLGPPPPVWRVFSFCCFPKMQTLSLGGHYPGPVPKTTFFTFLLSRFYNSTPFFPFFDRGWWTSPYGNHVAPNTPFKGGFLPTCWDTVYVFRFFFSLWRAGCVPQLCPFPARL